MRTRAFQSPRTGKFESNIKGAAIALFAQGIFCFNPLERGNSNQMCELQQFTRVS